MMAILVSQPPRSRQPAPPAALIVVRPAPRPPRSPSDAALREARRLWSQAVQRVKPKLEAEAEADPDRVFCQESERRRLMATDEGETVGRAAEAARRAVWLARDSDEQYQATLWMAAIECDAGHHREELRLTQRLVEWQPRNPGSWAALRRAAHCNGRGDLEQRAAAILTRVAGTHSAPVLQPPAATTK
jgi:hypothetical protein